MGAGSGDLRRNFSANGPEHDHVLPSLVVNPFVDQVVAQRYAEARPRLQDHVVALLAKRIPAPDRALDMGCGTGLSTKPLISWARVVVGVDVSEEMLTARAGEDDAHYVRARTERLPFPNDAFDLATAASAIRWVGSETIDEIDRVLKSNAWLVVYDVRFRSEMVGEEAFAQWMKDECAPRYPPVPKHEFTSTSVASFGFVPTWEADLRFDVPMTHHALVAYLMTHSERIAALREGRETEGEQETYLTEALGRFFPDAEPRLLAFGIPIDVFSR